MDTKRTTIYLPASLHRNLRRRASEADTTLSELVVRAVRALLSNATLPAGVAEPSPTYGDEATGPLTAPDLGPQGLLAAVGAFEGIEGADELDAVLSSVRQQAREREVVPLDEKADRK
jgi:hypothetical protein